MSEEPATQPKARLDLLVTGAGGQLGRALMRAAAARGLAVLGLTHAELAVEDPGRVLACLDAQRPRLVAHCAAWTDVDGCETEPERAELVNGGGTRHVARACGEITAGLVYLSTDFVFDGRAREPYSEDARPNPLSAYGRSKLSGERAVEEAGLARAWILRTSWVFGPGGRNFPRAILERARGKQELRVVDDQRGSPTLTDDLADALLDLTASDAASGIYHATNEGSCTWHEFARLILQQTGQQGIPLARMSSAELCRPAPRPAYSVLDCTKLATVRGHRLPAFSDALSRYLSVETA